MGDGALGVTILISYKFRYKKWYYIQIHIFAQRKSKWMIGVTIRREKAIYTANIGIRPISLLL